MLSFIQSIIVGIRERVLNWQNQDCMYYDTFSLENALSFLPLNFRANSIVTDLPELLSLMQQNIDKNKEKLVGSCQATPLTWGNSEQMKCLKDSTFSNVLDYIIVADCVYYEEVGCTQWRPCCKIYFGFKNQLKKVHAKSLNLCLERLLYLLICLFVWFS